MNSRCIEETKLLELISAEDSQLVRERVATAFVKPEGYDQLFWWEYFERKRQDFLAISADEPFDLIKKALPPDRAVYLVVEGGLRGKVFEGTALAVVDAIDSCYLNEYYVVPQSIDWLLCECHEAFAYAIGKVAVGWLKNAVELNA